MFSHYTNPAIAKRFLYIRHFGLNISEFTARTLVRMQDVYSNDQAIGDSTNKTFFFQELVSFYSIGLAETTIEKDDFESVQTMAKRYVQLIKTEQSTGPYYLGKSEVSHITI